ncbi:CYFA0S30e00364g1_1 [Cyberlindnera fabianii]|uniref:CYFA0S30e00364g1_1 n=1 Tax=Cyberlindnera fabianii TaxID=36022 RepID=A0A061BCZ0_CYBFA|nr:CYFA0S30e00364g1_1 [Cyberlindnera fabianii]
MSSQRPPFAERSFRLTDSPNPQWVNGNGTNDVSQTGNKVTIDPYEDGRPSISNYKLLTSAVTPHPIALISSVSSDGVNNLAPFSYFNMVNSDPPIFVVGISQGRNGKDTAKNIIETGECTINIISEWYVEAANASCVNAPDDVDELDLVGLNQEPGRVVKAPIVKESAFSIECKLVSKHDWFSKKDETRQTGSTFLLEGVMFHAREDVINETKDGIDFGKLKPVGRLGGSIFARVTEGFDLARPEWPNGDLK